MLLFRAVYSYRRKNVLDSSSVLQATLKHCVFRDCIRQLQHILEFLSILCNNFDTNKERSEENPDLG